MLPLEIIITRFRGATDYKGDRIQAQNLATHRRIIFDYDPALDGLANHRQAALRLVPQGRIIFTTPNYESDGYIFAIIPPD